MPTTKQRRQSARRRLDRQLARRAVAARRRRRRTSVGATLAAVLVVVGLGYLIVSKVAGGGASPPAAQASSSPTPSAGPTAAPIPAVTFAKASHAPRKTTGACRYAETAQTLQSTYTKDAGMPPDPAHTPATGTEPMTLETSQGTITVAMDRAKAPCTVQSFEFLTGEKFFDGTRCHRLTTSPTLSVLQCGDPSGTGQGGPTYQIKDEGLTGATYKRGTMAMANGGPNTNSSQFFLVYKDSRLPPSYTPVGTISSGLDVLDKIGKAGSDDANGQGDGKPILGVTIVSARTATPQ
ncbi:MAG: peptidylprolyl isomerase [Actinobacteria bacterium]|nr:peptidylprolyl isomerase [Actinomycetota bacterium]